jgi:6-pyruvoyltetrahydropterin/6-carboxytetrahydropterin synthase
MVVDFGVLKAIVNSVVVDRLDHSLVIRRSERNSQILGVLNDRFGRVVEVDYQPTCENMISDFAAHISAKLPEGVELTALRLYETATSYAEWLAEDNR